MIFISLDIDFIHGDIHGRLCKKHGIIRAVVLHNIQASRYRNDT